MNNPVVYIFLNKNLGMTTGKASAQAVHAAVFAMSQVDESKLQLWMASPHRTVIILEARDEDHIRNIEYYLSSRGYQTSKIVVEGVNEIDPHSITALSSGILEKDDENVIKTFSTFKLYSSKVKVNFEIET